MKHRFAFLTPSSNTVVEPWSIRMAQAFPDSSVHFGRIEVLQIDDSAGTDRQFQEDTMMDACQLLSHVRPDVIAWNGTSAAWLGVGQDRMLVKRIQEQTGCKAVTSTIATLEALARLEARRIALVTPYEPTIQQRIIRTFETAGRACVSERHFDITDNFAFGEIPPERIAKAAISSAVDGVEAIVILCTNLAGAAVAERIEQETGVPVLDSVTVTFWGCLSAVGADPRPLAPWGPSLAQLGPGHDAGAY